MLATPCHTTGHVLYLASHPAAQQRALFTGDTLFIGTLTNACRYVDTTEKTHTYAHTIDGQTDCD